MLGTCMDLAAERATLLPAARGAEQGDGGPALGGRVLPGWLAASLSTGPGGRGGAGGLTSPCKPYFITLVVCMLISVHVAGR